MITQHNPIRILAVAVALALATSLWANPISQGQAKSIASRFMASKTLKHVDLKHSQHAPRQGAYYVFNAQPGQGYVIVAGDDRLPSILGYSDTGTFDFNHVPPAMQQLLDYYAQCQAPSQPTRLIARDAIRPLTHSIWGQGAPFNKFLLLSDTTAVGDTIHWQAQPESAATAMAQLMYYHQWPQETLLPIPEYTTTTKGHVMPELPDTTFAWDMMRDAYHTTDSTAAGEAVALLYLYCAQALQTDLLETASTAAAVAIPELLTQYFGYDVSTRNVKRDTYSTQAWEDMLYAELQAHRPVIYRGDRDTDQHTFIIDGCDDTGLFHVNWGWDGQSNGYFVLSDLNPDAWDIEGAQEQCGYIMRQAMVIGAQPGSESTVQSNIRFHSMNVHGMSDNPVDSLGNYRVNVTGVFHNNTHAEKAFDYGWGLFQDGDMLGTLSTKSRTTPLAPNHQVTSTFDLEFGAELNDDTYYLRPIWSDLDANDWKVCEGGDLNFIEVTLAQDTCIYVLHGMAGTPEYVVNDLTFDGTLHAGKMVTATANITNLGYTLGDPIFLLDNGTKAYTTMIDVDQGCTGNIKFYFTPDTAGIHTITLSLLESGADTLFVQDLAIDSMPAVELMMRSQILNVTDTTNHIITSRTYSIEATINNVDTIAYDVDIVLRLFRIQDDENGIAIQDIAMPLQLAPGDSVVVQIDCDNVVDGEQYCCQLYYYSAGELIPCDVTPPHTIVFPEAPLLPGDINGDGVVDISDVNIVINIMLGKEEPTPTSDVTDDGQVDISDVNAVINIMLGKNS